MPYRLHCRRICLLLAVLVAAGALDASAAQGRTLALAVTVGDASAAAKGDAAPDGTARDTSVDAHPWAALLAEAPGALEASAGGREGTPSGMHVSTAGLRGAAARPVAVHAALADRRGGGGPLRHLFCVYRL